MIPNAASPTTAASPASAEVQASVSLRFSPFPGPLTCKIELDHLQNVLQPDASLEVMGNGPAGFLQFN